MTRRDAGAEGKEKILETIYKVSSRSIADEASPDGGVTMVGDGDTSWSLQMVAELLSSRQRLLQSTF